jgi:hypothetical protein
MIPDILVAATLILLSPFTLPIALLVRVTSPGSAICKLAADSMGGAGTLNAKRTAFKTPNDHEAGGSAPAAAGRSGTI